ncbi:type II toxin-antitoxin system RelE/ParE family toxin [Flavobacterium rhizosphaerae]|uniref:Type II toxin-antitoxin system RelE/ParE family toxin n=1 Tax=Flavobacterium rhizosphaerae TaxID=3163298 RepID=A0ABW8Z0F5_9FLAO
MPKANWTVYLTITLKNAGTNIAVKIIGQIISETNKLLIDPLTYPLEKLLLDREIEYRYFICYNYKIIYAVDSVNRLIKIADIFDTRQNP